MDEFYEGKPQIKGVNGLVFVGEKILTYLRDNKTSYYPNFIAYPGGNHESGETAFETFKRELFEEFHLPVKKEEIIYIESIWSHKYPGNKEYFVVAKLSKHLEDQIQFGDEGKEYYLWTLQELVLREDVVPFLMSKTLDWLSMPRSSSG